MNEQADAPDSPTAAERRLQEHLELLRLEPPRSSGQIVTRIMRSVRWQRALRRPLLALGSLGSAVAHALSLLIKPPARRS